MQSYTPNKKTIEAYNQEIGHYLQYTPEHYNKSHAPLLRWIDFSLNLLPKDEKIFEIGSGPGRDAKHIKNMGFQVVCTDASYAFVDHLRSQGHHDALKFDIIEDVTNDEYGMVFANAVVPHFTELDLIHALKKIRMMLKPGGVLAFSAKQGQGEEWISEKFHEKRFVHYWQPQQLIDIVNRLNYRLVYMEHSIPGDLPTHKWILITLTRI